MLDNLKLSRKSTHPAPVEQAQLEGSTLRVFRSDDEERKFVQCEEDNFIACFVYGEWFDRKVVDIGTMKELDLEDELYDVAMILRQAKKALRWA
jgi:hypothetical protein